MHTVERTLRHCILNMNIQFTHWLGAYFVQYTIQEILESAFLHQYLWHVPNLTNPKPSSEEKCKIY